MIKKILIMVITGVLLTGSLHADDLDRLYKRIAKEKRINPTHLKLLAILESSEHPFAINHEKKSYFFSTRKEAEDFLSMIPAHQEVDVGLMQIRSKWFRKIGIAKEEGLDPEVSLKIAAILVKDIFNRHGESLDNLKWYHSNKKSYQEDYLRKIRQIIQTGNHRIF